MSAPANTIEKAERFSALHVAGDPVVIYNAWDGGSAKAIIAAGAKAIATGDHPVGFAHGYSNDDFDDFTFESYLRTIRDIARVAGDIPFSVDINNANGLSGEELKQRITTLLDLGVIGINYEDRTAEGGLLDMEKQASRIKDIREVAETYGVPLHINARSDLFAMGTEDPASLLDEAVARAAAYQAAGANSFFAPGLLDTGLIRQLVERIGLPLNIIRLPGAPSGRELADAGVARISYGPVPQMEMTEWLTKQASAALNLEV